MKYCPICKACYEDVDDRCVRDRIFLIEAFPGQRLVDKYRIDALIGQGGMGAVYRATHLELDRVVALKVVLPDYVSSNETLERFRREARAAARLNHPSVITIYDFGVLENGRAYLAMELLNGRSLRDEIEKLGIISPKRSLDILKPVCEAVQAAHNAEVIHRDLKPDNIILESSEMGQELIKVVDFGIAKLKEKSGKALSLTGPGLVMGTPHYMSPEQCKGEELDTRSDVYSLGVMLYEMLAGQVPFDAPTPSAVIIQHAIDPPRRISLIRRDIKPEIEEVIMKALTKSRHTRQQTVMQLYLELEKAVAGAKPQNLFPSPELAKVPLPPLPPRPISKSITPRDIKALPNEESLRVSRKAETILDNRILDNRIIEEPKENIDLGAPTTEFLSEDNPLSITIEQVTQIPIILDENTSPLLEDERAELSRISDLDLEASELLVHTTNSYSNEIKLQEIATLQGHEHVVKAVSYTPDGKYLISCSSDGAIKIWDLKKKRVRGALHGHELAVNALAVSPNGKMLASTSSDGSVKIWDIASEKEIASFDKYQGSLRSVAFSPNNKLLVLANDANIELWDISSKERQAVFEGHIRLVEDLEFSHDGNFVISGGVDETIKIWDINKKSLVGTISCPNHCVNTLANSVDGIVATGGKDSTIRLWDVTSRSELALLEGHEASIRTIAFSARGDYLVSGDWDGIIKLWDTATGVSVTSVEAHESAILTVAFSPDEKQIASAGYDQIIKLWNVEGLEEL
ncbi:MAG: serine/threonine protein kinase [Acidobacteria bacterium]|nr:serine/threonine protein kinase [Acidobacteriota bacterium]